jgi:HlyD family secretion protein
MTARRRLVVLAAVIVTLAAAAGVWRWRASARTPAVRYETAAVDRGRVVARVTATGTLSALVTVQVGSQVSGRISALHADFNSQVKKGQLIAEIDPELFQASAAQARANVVAAEGNLAKAKAQALDAKRQLDRTRALFARQLVAAADQDTAQSNADAADASVQASEGAVAQARASLVSAQVNLAYTRIVSPTDGVVISRSVDVGQTVAASLQAPTVFVIAEDLAKMQVDTSVAEADVGRLAAGMPATFTVDAYPGDVFRGMVRQVRNAPQTVQNVVTYDAVVDVPNPDLKLKPGMTATVTFIYAEKTDVIRISNAALRFRPTPAMEKTLGTRASSGAGEADAGGPAPTAGKPQGAGGERLGAGRPGRKDAAAGLKAIPAVDAPVASADPPAAAEGGGGKRGGGGRTVWVLREGAPEAVRIQPGVSDGTFTEVVRGDLAPGDATITDVSGGPAASAGAGGFPGGARRGGGPF